MSAEPEVMWLIRRQDGEPMGGEFTFMGTSEGVWEPAIDDNDDGEEPVVYELLRTVVEVVETRIVAPRQPCHAYVGELQPARAWWTVRLRTEDELSKRRRNSDPILQAFPDEATATAYLTSLPESFTMLEIGGGLVAVEHCHLYVHDSTGPGYWPPCKTCRVPCDRHEVVS